MSFDGLAGVIVVLAIGAVLGFVLGRRSGQQRPPGTLEPITQRPAATDAATPMPAPDRPSIPSLPEANVDMPRQPSAPDRAPRRQSKPAPAAAPAPPAALLSAATSWGYQLQRFDTRAAAASAFDVLVIDYAKDGSDDTALKPADLERLKLKPDGSRRIVLAYISIGEAESYRSYWQDGWKKQPPAWLLRENPDWEENYAVCFWDPEWQSLLCGSRGAYLDRILAQGFDGIYLDKCDVTDDLKHHEKKAAALRSDLNGDMVALVGKLSAYARTQRPGFLVVMQNAETLLERAELRQAIDGVAKEELLFGMDAAERPNSADDIQWSRQRLDLMRRDGKPVFVVEYLNDRTKIAKAVEQLTRLGYVPYVSDKNRDLAKLNTGTMVA